jgi:hypothetical protein
MPKTTTPRKAATSPPLVSTPTHILPDGDITRSVSIASEPSEQDIRLRAYHRYLERGQQPGMDFEDWVAAERDLHPRHSASNDADPDAHKGAVEGDRPGDRAQQGNRRGPGVDRQGLPSDPVATAQDAVGARVDGTQG